MYCNQCGTLLNAGQPACPTCGRPTAGPRSSSGAPGASARMGDGRVTRHRKLLAVLWIIRGALLVPGGLILWLGFAHGAFFGPNLMMGAPGFGPMRMTFLSAVGIGVLVVGALSILTGVGLLQARPWARILAIVLGILELVSIPFGTALGIYTLWVLLPAPSEAEFRHLAGSLR